MEEMEQERRNQENEERERAERAKKIKEEFGETGSQWEKDKHVMEGMTQQDEQIKKEHDVAMADIESKKSKVAEVTKSADGDVKATKTVDDSEVTSSAAANDKTEGKSTKDEKAH